MYGFKKSFRWWFDIFVFKLKVLDFTPFNSDIYMFYNLKRRIYLMIYINDFLIVISIFILIIEVRDILVKLFELKNLDPVKLFLKIRIICDCPNRKIYLDQNEYIKKILDKFGYSDLNSIKTFWLANIKFPRI